MVVDADGAYHAFHPDDKSGLDFLANAGHPGNWMGLVTDNGATLSFRPPMTQHRAFMLLPRPYKIQVVIERILGAMSMPRLSITS